MNIYLKPKNLFEFILQKTINYIIKKFCKIFSIDFIYNYIKKKSSFLTGDFFEKLSDCNFKDIKKKKCRIIFSDLSQLKEISKSELLNKVWIFHNSDLQFGNKEHRLLKKIKPKICFSTNVVMNNKYICNIPIGLENKKYSIHHLFYIDLLKNLKKKLKKNKILYGFNETHYVRKKYKRILKQIELCKETSGWHNLIYRLILKKYKFVFCPRGNGYDTHRIWEAMYSKTMPILIKDKFNTFYYKNKFPIMMINSIYDLKKLNENKLEKFYRKNYKKFKNKKLYEKYWKNKILHNI